VRREPERLRDILEAIAKIEEYAARGRDAFRVLKDALGKAGRERPEAR
jgi:hypothetical protein